MDENLLQLLRDQPEKGLEMLMDSYLGLVYTIVRNKLYSICSTEDIEECISSVFFEIYESRNNIDLSKGSLKAFLAVIAKRRAIDLYRNKEIFLGKVVSFDGYDPENSLPINQCEVDRETKSVLLQSINALGEPDREIFIRKYYLGESTKTIAKSLGFKENTVDKKVSRGLAKLKNMLGGIL
ncbi:sigma-70 family RNA polymerase sigma factor [Pseudobacteroides cellulosolvens]|uniref:RNA polymerase, sigma-24 subunit, RpoE, ECF subfamily n=1 Tax=Pseudobacteroides cellulosolvens ATCC 35603 = DSM 2933 TaxID=398512 RepID=A0A0L6JQP0_9FIRM|nr:sigma-70 family RNA polymerase sigma factor [Pseudobacteroides cellulosolvens]KNY28156.1 RNA polymerase, sigma-24 subunit, RpoE, ECF subfamily [Pseudobacteroides cellulosolvens ATCC 35603 = DSM 2933]